MQTGSTMVWALGLVIGVGVCAVSGVDATAPAVVYWTTSPTLVNETLMIAGGCPMYVWGVEVITAYPLTPLVDHAISCSSNRGDGTAW
jgi:hypothetical protein